MKNPKLVLGKLKNSRLIKKAIEPILVVHGKEFPEKVVFTYLYIS